MDKDGKIDTIKEIIKVKIQTARLEHHYNELSSRVDKIEDEHANHRKKSNEIKRTAWEAMNLATGNRDKVELNSHRITDTKEKYDSIEDGIKWIVRATIGLMITIIGTVVLDQFLHLF